MTANDDRITVTESVHQELFQGFANPQSRFSPVAGWWWTAEPLELERLKWQLDQLNEHGVHNVLPVNLAPAGPMYGALADDPALFSDQWWDLWRGICEHAEDRDIGIFFYDQIGFGGSNVQGQLVTTAPELSGASLDRVVVDTDEPCEITLPRGALPVSGCTLPIDPNGTVVGSPQTIELRGDRLVWQAPAADGRYRVMLAYSRDEGFDYLSAKACQRLFDSIHGEFERRLGPHLGKVIIGSFQDELPDLPSWSKTFADDFERYAGYRIEPVVAALWEDWGVESARVRIDYQRVRARLAEAAFFRPLFEWHENHGMIFGFDQQSPSRSGEPAATVRQYADYLRTHRWFSAPGSDHWGTAKLHSSLAHHYQRPRTWIEAFHSTGWGGTLEETFDWLMPWLLAGASLYLPHAAYYSTRGGWWEWAPPSTCWRQPYWRHYGIFADAVSRLCWLLTRGEHICDVAVLFPTTAVQASTLLDGVLPEIEPAQKTYLELVGQMAWFYTVPGAITDAGRDFDVIDDDTLSSSRVSGGRLETAAESYRAVVVPASRVLDSATAGVLVEFCEKGGLVIFIGKAPEHASDEAGDGDVQRLRQLIDEGKAELVADPSLISGALDTILKVVDLKGRYLHRRVGEQNLLLIPAAPTGSAVAQPMLPWVGELSEIGGEPRPLLDGYFEDMVEGGYKFDNHRYRASTKVLIRGDVADLEQWDPATGRARPAAAHHIEGGVEVDVDFAGGPAAILVWRDGSDASLVSASPQIEDWEETVLEGPWTISVLPTLDNRYGDLGWPPSSGPFPVQQWRLRHVTDEPGFDDRLGPEHPDFDDTSWPEVVVGFGTYAWRSGPSGPGELPEPLPPGHRVELGGPGWSPVEYSLSRGINKDPIHTRALGPKGRVPEDFWHVDDVSEGQAVALRTSLPVEAGGEVTLAIAANGSTEFWWNGERLAGGHEGYLRLESVQAREGPNLLEVRVTADRDGPLRGYWTLTTDRDASVRPEWLSPEDGSVPGTEVRARGEIRLEDLPVSATFQVGTEGAASVYVNGNEVGRQGTFDPYGNTTRVIPYDVAALLQPGDNVLEVVLADEGAPVAVFVDGAVIDTNGQHIALVSDGSWTLLRDGEPMSIQMDRTYRYDPRWPMLRPRPHPLPRANWLDLSDQHPREESSVLDIIPDAEPFLPRPAAWFRTRIPPGAVRAHLPIDASSLRVWVDGLECEVRDDTVSLAEPYRQTRAMAVWIEPVAGHRGGALWSGPITFEMSEGRAELQDWAELGLASYSGGVTYRRTVEVTERGERAILDLGQVRGTAEVAVNGTWIGSRIWSPYRLDLSDALRPGENTLEVTVFNTLAPYLDDTSPTRMVFPGQRSSGLLGPVRLLTC